MSKNIFLNKCLQVNIFLNFPDLKCIFNKLFSTKYVQLYISFQKHHLIHRVRGFNLLNGQKWYHCESEKVI